MDKEVSFLRETKSQNKNQIPKFKKKGFLVGSGLMTSPEWPPVDLSLHKMRGRDRN